MKIQFRVLKHIGGEVFLVHIAKPADLEKLNPNGDQWIHLGVIVMEKSDIEFASKEGLQIIWTNDLMPTVSPSIPAI